MVPLKLATIVNVWANADALRSNIVRRKPKSKVSLFGVANSLRGIGEFSLRI